MQNYIFFTNPCTYLLVLPSITYEYYLKVLELLNSL